jgi:hypothetical protein
MPPVRVLSPEAERAVRLLMATLAQHRRQEAVLALGPAPALGRLRAVPSGRGSVDVRRQATLMRLTSIVEAFVADSLVSRLEPHAPPPRTPVLDDVYLRAEDNAIATWPKMREHYGRWFNIKLSTTACASWRRIEAMTNARNAVAHGLGELTRRMARKGLAQLARDLATVDIVIVGHTLVISELALRSSASAGREFVGWLDQELEVYDATLKPAVP